MEKHKIDIEEMVEASGSLVRLSKIAEYSAGVGLVSSVGTIVAGLVGVTALAVAGPMLALTGAGVALGGKIVSGFIKSKQLVSLVESNLQSLIEEAIQRGIKKQVTLSFLRNLATPFSTVPRLSIEYLSRISNLGNKDAKQITLLLEQNGIVHITTEDSLQYIRLTSREIRAIMYKYVEKQFQSEYFSSE